MSNPLVINDAVHGVISFDGIYSDILEDIMNFPTFQRLRHIKSLGLVDLIFPTAVHNRFNHSIGAAYIAICISKKLQLPEDDCVYAFISTLFHDIGHGPFSHAFEKLTTKDGKLIKHEEWTHLFMREYKYIFDKYGIDYNTVANIIDKNQQITTAEGDTTRNIRKIKFYQVVSDIVSSQIDADRLDYLLRDSYFCGVQYGKVDIWWIINHMVIINIEEKCQENIDLSFEKKNYFNDGERKTTQRLGLNSRGWRSIEHFLTSRRFMTQNIYHHYKKNTLEELLIIFVTEVSKNKEILKKYVKNKNLYNFFQNLSEFISDKNINHKDFITENFQYYKTIIDYDIWILIRDIAIDSEQESNPCYKIAKKIYITEIHKSFKFQNIYLKNIEDLLKAAIFNSFCFYWEIFVTENSVISYKSDNEPIFILDSNNKITRIEDYSMILRTLENKQEKEFYLSIDNHMWENKKDEIIKIFGAYVEF